MNNEMLSQKGKRTEKPSALGGLGTSIRRKWKEECMNHGRGERTDHLPIFDKTMPDRISRLTGTKAISINQRSLRRGFHREKKMGGARKRCVAEGRRERRHALIFFLSPVIESMN